MEECTTVLLLLGKKIKGTLSRFEGGEMNIINKDLDPKHSWSLLPKNNHSWIKEHPDKMYATVSYEIVFVVNVFILCT